MLSLTLLNKLINYLTLSHIDFVGKRYDAILFSAIAKLFTAVVSCSSDPIVGILKRLSSDHLNVSVVAIPLVLVTKTRKHRK